MNILIINTLIGVISVAHLLILLAGLAFLCLPLLFYCLTLQRTLDEISIENRKMPSGQVWLTLIPLFGLVWQFFIVNKMADSLKAEFAKRNIIAQEVRPGYTIGLAYCILFCLGIIPLMRIVGIVCWIKYWVKISKYKTMLQRQH